VIWGDVVVPKSWGSIGAWSGNEFTENRAGKFESDLSMVSIVNTAQKGDREWKKT
jgi:hypothetical protein